MLDILVSENQAGLVFVAHGLGGSKDEAHIRVTGEAFAVCGFTVVWYNNSRQQRYEDQTVTGSIEDLEDLIEWAKNQEWYEEPFWLAGHSLGGVTVAEFAARNPEKVVALLPVSSLVSGKLSSQSAKYKDAIAEWKEKGWVEKYSNTLKRMVRLPWSHMEDRLEYDLVKDAPSLTMPVLIIVGSEDDGTPPEHQKILFDALTGQKQMHVIQGSGHVPRLSEHLAELKQTIIGWIKLLSHG